MRYNGVRLEKGMYQEHGRTFSHVLESITQATNTLARPWRDWTLFSASSSASTSR